LEEIYLHPSTDQHVKRMIEKRWALSGGRYINGEFRTFEEVA
jgi:hypothetical protein